MCGSVWLHTASVWCAGGLEADGYICTYVLLLAGWWLLERLLGATHVHVHGMARYDEL